MMMCDVLAVAGIPLIVVIVTAVASGLDAYSQNT